MILLVKIFFISLLLSSLSYGQLMSPYTIKVGRLNNLEKKIADQKTEIKGLLKAIQAAKSEDKKQEYFESVKATHLNLQETIKDYNKVRLELKYEYPKKNDQTVRRYLPLREQTIDEIENETGIDSVLTRVKHKIDQKYRNFTLEKEVDSGPESSKSKNIHKEDENRLVIER